MRRPPDPCEPLECADDHGAVDGLRDSWTVHLVTFGVTCRTAAGRVFNPISIAQLTFEGYQTYMTHDERKINLFVRLLIYIWHFTFHFQPLPRSFMSRWSLFSPHRGWRRYSKHTNMQEDIMYMVTVVLHYVNPCQFISYRHFKIVAVVHKYTYKHIKCRCTGIGPCYTNLLGWNWTIFPALMRHKFLNYINLTLAILICRQTNSCEII